MVKPPKTKLGKFLQGLKFKNVLGAIGAVVTGDVKGAIDIITDKDNGLSQEEMDHAIKLLEQDMVEMREVSRRWESDMESDSWLSKNVRPLMLIFLTVTTMLLIYIDFYHGEEFDVPTEWIDLLKSLLLGIYMAYFGSRGIEKSMSIRKKGREL